MCAGAADDLVRQRRRCDVFGRMVGVDADDVLAYGMDSMVHVAAAGLFLAPLLAGPDAIRVRRVEIYREALSPMLQTPIVTSRKS